MPEHRRPVAGQDGKATTGGTRSAEGHAPSSGGDHGQRLNAQVAAILRTDERSRTNPQGTGNAPGAARQAGGRSDVSGDHAKPLTQQAPQLAGIPAQEVSISIGHGAVTGEVVLSLTPASTGFALDGGHVKIAENKAKLALDGFAAKLEGTVLSGGLSSTSIDGLQLTFGVSALSVGTQVGKDGLTPSADVLAVEVGVHGDVTHWLGSDVPGVKCTLDGTLKVALGDKIAEQLADLAAKEKQERALAGELETAGDELTANEAELATLEERRAVLEAGGASRETLDALEEQILARRGAVWRAEEQITQVGKALPFAREAAEEAAKEVEGPVARQLARMMEHEAVKVVAEKLAHIVPVLNVVMYTIDAIQAARAIYHVARGGGRPVIGDTPPDNDWKGARPDGTPTVGPGATGPVKPAKAGDGRPAAGGQHASGSASVGSSNSPDAAHAVALGSTPSDHGSAAIAVARRKLTPAARSVMEALAPHDGPGVELGPSDIEKLGALVPSDLSPSETREVIAQAQQAGARATTAADALAAIDSAVRSVRGRTLDTPGGPAPDAAATDGPITDPSQVDSQEQQETHARSGGAGRAVDPSNWLLVVKSAPPSVIARWFVEDHGELVPSEELDRWKSANVRSVAGSLELVGVTATSARIPNSDVTWNVEITFRVRQQQNEKQLHYSFMVTREPSNLSGGASFNGLRFVPYFMIDL